MSERPESVRTDSADLVREQVVLDVESTDHYQKKIEHESARTRNQVALILTWAIVLVLPLLMIFKMIGKSDGMDMDKVFDKWFAVVGPLAGAAVGAYSVSSRKQ